LHIIATISNQILHSDKDHQIHAILIIEMQFGTVTYTDPSTVLAVKNLNF